MYVINTAEELPSNMFYGEYEPRPRGIWSAHNNAIFDIQWLSVCAHTLQGVQLLT